jgi:hypothetical protein
MKRKAQTKRLTTDERLLIPYLEKILLRTNKENPKFNDEIIKE